MRWASSLRSLVDSTANLRTGLTRRRIDPARVLREVIDDSAGGTVVFVGTVRNRSEFGAVDGLEYQAYGKMARKRMKLIGAELMRRWKVRKVSIYHREGKLRVGEISVVVAVSAAHRAEAFEASRYAIDKVKKAAPIWKKESVRGAGRWVEGRPIDS
jgi:molybdopterin synthase catalytic subunit